MKGYEITYVDIRMALKILRARRGISIETLAKRMKVRSSTAIVMLNKCKSVDSLLRVLAALECSPVKFFLFLEKYSREDLMEASTNFMLARFAKEKEQVDAT